MRYLIILILIAIGIGAYIYLSPKTLKKGDTIPPFELETARGKFLDIEKYEGKALLIVFFSVDDDVSRDVFSDFHFISDQFKGDADVRFIAIAVDGTPERLKLFLSQYRFPGDVLVDDGTFVAEVFQVTSFPMFYITNGERKIVYTIEGFARNDIRELTPALRRAKKED
ncbi:MAG: TlpA family protein disulfide reductase [Ignavibacteria bacterium]|nr:TlpA family protein disulfide reductase [Ignavibacteria bacterium]